MIKILKIKIKHFRIPPFKDVPAASCHRLLKLIYKKGTFYVNLLKSKKTGIDQKPKVATIKLDDILSFRSKRKPTSYLESNSMVLKFLSLRKSHNLMTESSAAVAK